MPFSTLWTERLERSCCAVKEHSFLSLGNSFTPQAFDLLDKEVRLYNLEGPQILGFCEL